jgi:hypothetical protein
MLYKLSPNINTQDAVTELTTIFNKYDPAYPYDYSFSDEQYASKFNLEQLIGKLAGLFAVLAIFIYVWDYLVWLLTLQNNAQKKSVFEKY